jgi:Kyanoviridae DNA primase/helicase
MNDRLEITILRNLINDEEYVRNVLPFIEPEYFSGSEKTTFEIIKEYFLQFNKLPTREAVLIEAEKSKNLEGDQLEEVQEVIKSLRTKENDSQIKEWLLERTEKFCQEQAVTNAVFTAAQILNGTNKKIEIGAVPDLLQKALAISFDPHVGHDYLEDADERFAYYHRKEEKLPFHLSDFNDITNGGLPKGTLSVIMAGTNVGKTIFMCDMAANHLMMGKNVLYITLEMAEEAISKRIDANLLNVPIDDLEALPKDLYDRKIEKVKEKTKGKLIIKEYPTAGAHVGHFRHLLHELLLKSKFVPDIIYIDYINICSSARIKKTGDSSGGYYYIKSIAEEIRGLAVEMKVPIVSATQLNRTGFSDSDPDMASTSESFALPMTLDFMVVLTTNEALEAIGQLQVKQLKSRFGDKSKKPKFIIGVDKNYMRFHDVEKSAQTLINTTTESDDLEMDEKEERIKISKKQGSSAYKPGYNKVANFKKNRKSDFSDFKI